MLLLRSRRCRIATKRPRIFRKASCDLIPEALLKKAVEQGVKIVTTMDTLSKCSGLAVNGRNWAAFGGEFLYGAEVAHPDIPCGINAQELMYMRQMAKMELRDVLRAATSRPGEHLNLQPLGTLQRGPPADIIAAKGDLSHNLKILEYPILLFLAARSSLITLTKIGPFR
jgi:hypothetical protein